MSEKEIITVRLPKLGESILGATVVQWFKKEGETVVEDEPLLEVATDKVNSEIPSPAAGIITELLAEVNQEIEIGAPLLSLRPIGEVDLEAEQTTEPTYKSHPEHHEATKGFISPAVLHLVREQGIGLDELDKIKGSGQGGRITKKDVQSYALARGGKRKSPEVAPTPPPVGGVERQPMSPMRKAIADNMTRSFYTAPHAYIVNEVDVTELMASLAEKKVAFLAEHGFKLTITSCIVKALATAVEQFPLVNSSLEEDTIILKKEVNVGIAVAVGDGLVVPVIKSCQSKSIIDIAGAIADLSTRARGQKLKPDEVRDGTITLTNFGMSGALVGLPIIRFPEVAILGVGAIKKRVGVFANDQFGIRSILNATLSLDHRALDGMYAGSFLQAFQQALESMTV